MYKAARPYHRAMTFSTPPDGLRSLFDAQHHASRAQVAVPLALRRDRLLRIQALLNENGAALAQAVQLDFGVRSPQLTEIADLFVLRTMLSSTLKNLAKWMKPVRVSTPLYLQPSRAYLLRQPLGVVGVVSPWNYPVQLSLGPVITALAAGNRVMLKPSELTPQTSALLAELIGKAFAPDERAWCRATAAWLPSLRACRLSTFFSPAQRPSAAKWPKPPPPTSRRPRWSWAASRPASLTRPATWSRPPSRSPTASC